jgi:MaoC dehydratase-like protein
MNSQLEGKVYPHAPFEVNAERVRAFALAVGVPEGSVPPTFATVAEFEALPRIVADPELGLDFTRVLHGEQEYEWRRPLVLGESLTAVSRIASIRHKGGNGFLTVETELRGEGGEVVVLARATLIERSPS